MRTPGQTWPGATAWFLGMWVGMMVAMMLPSLVPMLWRYRQAVSRIGETRLGAKPFYLTKARLKALDKERSWQR